MNMKSLYGILILLLFVGCEPSIEEQMEKAEAIFIDEVQYMTYEDALSNEIDYYREPEITTRTHKRSLTGTELIKECNRVKKEDDDMDYIQLGPTSFKRVRYVDNIKEYAIKHPDDIIANEFFFVGTFTNYANGYSKEKAKIIYVPKLDWYIIDR